MSARSVIFGADIVHERISVGIVNSLSVFFNVSDSFECVAKCFLCGSLTVIPVKNAPTICVCV